MRPQPLRSIPSWTLAVLLVPTVACTADVGIHDVVATLDPNIANVVHVTWTTDTPTFGAVEFGTDTGYGQASPTEPEATTEHSATMLGLYANSDYHFRVLGTPEGGEVQEGDDAVTTTGALPSEVPDVEIVTAFEPADARSMVLASWESMDQTENSLFVFDEDGAVVWYWLPAIGVNAVHALADGTGVYYVDSVPELGEDATLTIVTYGGQATSFPCAYCHHDVAELADGSFATVRSTFQDIDGERIGGDQVVTIAADGTLTVVWDAFDHLTVVENIGWDAGQLPGAADWTHANGIVYDAVSDSFLLSLYGPQTVVSIQHATGLTNWVLGGPDNQFAGGEDIGVNHAPRFFEEGVLLFNNGRSAGGSKVVEWAVDPMNLTAEQTWSWAPEARLYTPVLGDAHRYADGSVLSSWGITGHILMSDTDGVIVGDAAVTAASLPINVGQVTPLTSLYPDIQAAHLSYSL